MSDTENLRPYKNRNIPVMEGSLPSFISDELQSISASITAIVKALKLIEARLVAGGH
jgi:hypothetical protein